jgi:hypothetical protein
MRLLLLSVGLLSVCSALAFPPQYPPQIYFTTPGDIEENAVALEGTTLQLNPSTITDVEKTGDDECEITFTDPDNYKTLTAHVPKKLVPVVKSSDVLYVRIVTAGRYRVEIELLGNSIETNNHGHPPQQYVWADY